MILLAVWRLTHLLTEEGGPFNIFEKFRNISGKPFTCFYCLSMWVSIIPSIFYSNNITSFILYWLSLSGGAILLEKISDRYI
jgi:hypothetical protein